jgi:hypothetical protein
MSDFDTLRELFKMDALIALEESPYGKKIVTLSEPADAINRGYSVTINSMPEEAVVIKTDKFPPPHAIFNNHKGECKRADFVIIAHAKNINWIVYIEMKRGKGNTEKDIIHQLQGAECVIAYCRAIGKTFWARPDFLNPEAYQSRFVSIREIGIAKKPSRLPPLSGLHDSPEKMLKINAPRYLQFNQLVGKV